MTPERLRQIETVFHAARERPSSARDAFLADACLGDSALRRDVERLLLQPSPGLIDAPVSEVVAGLITPDPRLEPGSLLGHYRIDGLLGIGGMGEVYRARDTKLGRDVAIKILPRALTSDHDRLTRFEREARVLASLNHPHISGIYGIEDGEGVRALVLELVDGETLSERLQRGPLPIDEAVTIARQIADALTAAHQKGIVHRDLKPANVKISAAGVVKVLDFGLAKVSSLGASAADLSHSAAMAANGTRDGIILGTVAYMSPEQARGQVVDKRTDIWAFGCVLFEMLAGRAAFARETLTDTLAAIVNLEPDWTDLPGATPPSIRRLLGRCLEKDSARRLSEITEVRGELEPLAAARAPQSRPRLRVAALIALTVALIGGGAVLFSLTKAPTPVTSLRDYIQLTNFTDSAVSPSLSPDGRMVTFIRGGEAFLSRGQIHVKLLPNGESVQLTDDSRFKYSPVFTPDGSRITYSVVSPGHWDSWSVPVLGGQPSQFLPNASGLTWIADHQVLFSEVKNPGAGLHIGIVTATESRAGSRDIYLPPNEVSMAHYSYLSPDHQSMLVVEMNAAHAFNQPCRLVPFDGHTMGRQVGPQGTCTSAAWSPDGRWMYFGAAVGSGVHLWRQRFPDGVPEQVTFGPFEEEGVAVAPDGRSLVTSVGTRRSAVWIHDGTGERPLSSEGYALLPRFSSDGKRVFYLLVQEWELGRTWRPLSAELRSVDLASGKSESVLPGMPITDYDLSRDGKEVTYTATDKSGTPQIGLASLDRSSPPHLIAPGDSVSFGADGDLVFRSREDRTNVLARVKKNGSMPERIHEPILDKFAASPDGEWVLVHSIDSNVAVPTHGGTPKKICLSSCMGAWSADGRLFYVMFDRDTLSTAGKTLVISLPPGKSLPDLPVSGIESISAGATLPGARIVDNTSLVTGPDPSTFVFTKTDLQRNLFRIPLH
jgi:serine/threonine protein kinase